MKNNRYSLHLAVVFFLMTVLLALLSWIGSIYGGEPVQSMLSMEGVRWILRHVVSDYVQTPALGIVFVMLMGLGIGSRAGLYHALVRFFRKGSGLSGRERRALTLASAVWGGYMVVAFCSMFFLKSVTGELVHSPFLKGLVYILSFGVGLSGMVYGFASNSYRTTRDVITGMSSLIASRASYFVTLFMVVQFFSALSYTGLGAWMGLGDDTLSFLFQVCCYLPLLVKDA